MTLLLSCVSKAPESYPKKYTQCNYMNRKQLSVRFVSVFCFHVKCISFIWAIYITFQSTSTEQQICSGGKRVLPCKGFRCLWTNQLSFNSCLVWNLPQHFTKFDKYQGSLATRELLNRRQASLLQQTWSHSEVNSNKTPAVSTKTYKYGTVLTLTCYSSCKCDFVLFLHLLS
jgi:hypothetical protein